MQRVLPLLVLSCVVAPALAQDLRLRDRSIPLAAAYDNSRGRLIVLGNRGETSEVTFGAAALGGWHQRAVPLRAVMQPQLCYDGARGVTWMLDNDLSAQFLDLTVAKYDGVAWQDVATVGVPTKRTGFTMAYDSARSVVLLFGGADLQGVPIGETWTFDGLSWTLQSPANAPSARLQAALADDQVRGRVVLFGGYGNGRLDDTWEWDGTNWQARAAAQRPSPRHQATLVFDAGRARTVLFGGSVGGPAAVANDTWEWDGQAWSQVSPSAPLPSPRFAAAGVYDPALGEVVLAGGLSFGDLHRDLWSFDGARWQPLSIPTQRPFLPRGVAAVEPQGNSVVTFGGLDAAEYATADTWRFQAGAWSQLTVSGPPARIDAAICTGATECWMFGGSDYHATPQLFGDLWRWDGANWSQVVAAGPSPRTGSSMTFDSTRNQVVLFGGGNLAGWLGDTWTFDGSAWQQRQPASSPPPRAFHAMAYDPLLDRTVLTSGEWVSDTWLWDGVTWSVATGNWPGFAGGQATAAFDAQRLQVVVRRGYNGSALGWSFDGQGWTSIGELPPFYGRATTNDRDGQVLGLPYAHGLLLVDGANLHSLSSTSAQAVQYGTGCGSGVLQVVARGWAGLASANHAIEVQGAPANSFAALVGAVQNASIPIAGCTLLVLPGQLLTLVPTTAFGGGALPLPVPTNPAFVGVDLFFQAAALDPSAPAGVALSRGLQITVGD